ncbi:Hint domain-containing protein, partial [Roseicyclus sp.]|uniref:Hint domain-containing protein n=1 Tax=Roseicyclus sp. TaxID=1914329 RepID=UPI003BAF21AF
MNKGGSNLGENTGSVLNANQHAAKDLLQIAGVTLADDVSSLSYHHLLFDDHEIVFANGIPAESL